MSTVALVGAGPIGRAAVRALLDDHVAAAVSGVADPNEDARVAAEEEFACTGHASAGGLPVAHEGAWAVVAFSSRAGATGPAIEQLLGRGYHCVTTCEELSDPGSPWRSRLGDAARRAERTVIATGANPGFVMDRFALAVATASRRVTAVEVSRRVDTATRRGPLVAKSGRGLSEDEFRRRAGKGTIGHVGLAVSARLLAAGLGWEPTEIDESIEPVIAADGSVDGQHQTVRLRTAAGEQLAYDLTMAWGVDRPGDAVVVHGLPEVRVEIPGGYHGDEGTTAQVVNAVRRAPTLSPGFHLPIDLPLSIVPGSKELR